jgi:thiamine pyridinylase
LRVALFPSIPDPIDTRNETLRHFLEQQFENTYPEVDVQIRPLNPADDYHDSGLLRRWLSRTGPGPHYDLIEIDAVLLGEITDAIVPWFDMRRDDWLPVAEAAVTFNGRVLGFPHWLCGHYVITRLSDAANANSLAELEKVLRRAQGTERDMAGDILGSWNMPALFIDAFRDTYPRRDPREAIAEQLDATVLDSFKSLVQLCQADSSNPCLDGTYDDNDAAVTAFAVGKADALLGYSERLHHVFRAVTARAEQAKIHIGPAPLGRGNHPILFVDAFVRPARLPPGVDLAARRFAEFMNRPDIHEAIVMSLDAAGGAVPRYLLPAMRSAYDAPSVAADPHYKQLRSTVTSGVPFPREGLERQRRAMRTAILTYLRGK